MLKVAGDKIKGINGLTSVAIAFYRTHLQRKICLLVQWCMSVLGIASRFLIEFDVCTGGSMHLLLQNWQEFMALKVYRL